MEVHMRDTANEALLAIRDGAADGAERGRRLAALVRELAEEAGRAAEKARAEFAALPFTRREARREALGEEIGALCAGLYGLGDAIEEVFGPEHGAQAAAAWKEAVAIDEARLQYMDNPAAERREIDARVLRIAAYDGGYARGKLGGEAEALARHVNLRRAVLIALSAALCVEIAVFAALKAANMAVNMCLVFTFIAFMLYLVFVSLRPELAEKSRRLRQLKKTLSELEK